MSMEFNASSEQPRGESGSETRSVGSSLLDLVRRDDPGGWQRLTNLFGPVVYGWCRGAGLQDHDAADVGQEVFRALATSMAGFRREKAGDSFRGWLWTITRNKIRDHWRRHRGQAVAPGGTAMRERVDRLEAPELDEAPPDDSDATAPESGSGVHRRALAFLEQEFTPRTWKAFWQTAVGGRDPGDVAQDLGISTNAVYLAKSRVLKRLRDEFGELLT